MKKNNNNEKFTHNVYEQPVLNQSTANQDINDNEIYFYDEPQESRIKVFFNKFNNLYNKFYHKDKEKNNKSQEEGEYYDEEGKYYSSISEQSVLTNQDKHNEYYFYADPQESTVKVLFNNLYDQFYQRILSPIKKFVDGTYILNKQDHNRELNKFKSSTMEQQDKRNPIGIPINFLQNNKPLEYYKRKGPFILNKKPVSETASLFKNQKKPIRISINFLQNNKPFEYYKRKGVSILNKKPVSETASLFKNQKKPIRIPINFLQNNKPLEHYKRKGKRPSIPKSAIPEQQDKSKRYSIFGHNASQQKNLREGIKYTVDDISTLINQLSPLKDNKKILKDIRELLYNTTHENIKGIDKINIQKLQFTDYQIYHFIQEFNSKINNTSSQKQPQLLQNLNNVIKNEQLDYIEKLFIDNNRNKNMERLKDLNTIYTEISNNTEYIMNSDLLRDVSPSTVSMLSKNKKQNDKTILLDNKKINNKSQQEEVPYNSFFSNLDKSINKPKSATLEQQTKKKTKYSIFGHNDKDIDLKDQSIHSTIDNKKINNESQQEEGGYYSSISKEEGGYYDFAESDKSRSSEKSIPFNGKKFSGLLSDLDRSRNSKKSIPFNGEKYPSLFSDLDRSRNSKKSIPFNGEKYPSLFSDLDRSRNATNDFKITTEADKVSRTNVDLKDKSRNSAIFEEEESLFGDLDQSISSIDEKFLKNHTRKPFHSLSSDANESRNSTIFDKNNESQKEEGGYYSFISKEEGEYYDPSESDKSTRDATNPIPFNKVFPKVGEEFSNLLSGFDNNSITLQNLNTQFSTKSNTSKYISNDADLDIEFKDQSIDYKNFMRNKAKQNLKNLKKNKNSQSPTKRRTSKHTKFNNKGRNI